MSAPRSTPLDPATLSEAQRRVYAATAASKRGTVPANVLAWLPSPELAQRRSTWARSCATTRRSSRG